VFLLPVWVPAQAPVTGARTSTQSSTGNCSPNIVSNGNGPVTVQYFGSCTDDEKRLLKELLPTIRTLNGQLPETIKNLNELLKMKSKELATRVAEVESLTTELRELLEEEPADGELTQRVTAALKSGDVKRAQALLTQLRTADITATLTVDNGEQGNPCPPLLFATTLYLVGSTRFAKDLPPRSLDTDALASGSELKITALGSPPITENGGEGAHETCLHSIKFNGFSGSLGILKHPYRWKGAWLVATVQGEGNDKQWDEFYDLLYEPADHTALQQQFREFYGLPKGDDTFGRSTGLKETITIFVDGQKIGSVPGIVTRSGDGFHGLPDKYTVKFRPFPVPSSAQILK
jgi:hypothetical protein